MVNESQKRLIVDQMIDGDYKAITNLAVSFKTETLYMYSYSSMNPEDPDLYELATSAEELTKIRDLLINVVSKIESNYGLEQSVKYVEAI